ncbi:unnamed protein product [Arabis nemorensis]|uniref:Armadillo repeat-containing domain-containing protein n=1 Tax=Arabis nemorensis TaxID=586526 RepID=A0A565B7X4_9BRAS|nr:unnamed protein product [Arabis nemorensis]
MAAETIIKSLVRLEGGSPPLVELLEFDNAKVQRAAAGALRTLAFRNDDNKNQIVDRNALPTLILMLGSEDVAIHYEAKVLDAGALQPIINLFRHTWCKKGGGAVCPLIEMLQSPEVKLKEMSAFALGRLAQLLHSGNRSLQHNAAFALYGLADNEVGGVQKLQDVKFIVHSPKVESKSIEDSELRLTLVSPTDSASNGSLKQEAVFDNSNLNDYELRMVEPAELKPANEARESEFRSPTDANDGRRIKPTQGFNNG